MSSSQLRVHDSMKRTVVKTQVVFTIHGCNRTLGRIAGFKGSQIPSTGSVLYLSPPIPERDRRSRVSNRACAPTPRHRTGFLKVSLQRRDVGKAASRADPPQAAPPGSVLSPYGRRILYVRIRRSESWIVSLGVHGWFCSVQPLGTGLSILILIRDQGERKITSIIP